MMRCRHAWAGALAMVAVVWLGAVPAQAKTALRIGVIQPLTGFAAFDGQRAVQGARLAAEEINARGKVLGHSIEILAEDGACDPAASASAAEKLISRDRVVALQGTICSSATGAIMPAARRNRVPLITGTSSAPQLTRQGNKWFFRIPTTEAMNADVAIPYLVKALKIRRASILVLNDDWGRSYGEAVADRLKRQGVKVVSQDFFEEGTEDFSPFLTKVKALKPDAFFQAAESQDSVNLFRQMKQIDLEATRITPDSTTVPHFIELAGSLVNGIYSTGKYVYTLQTPRNRAFVQTFRKRFGSLPGSYVVGAYDSIYILADAIRRAGGAKDPQKFRDALAKTDLEVTIGKISFDEQGQGLPTVYLSQIREGKPVVLKSWNLK